jgi:hypothetical protein
MEQVLARLRAVYGLGRAGGRIRDHVVDVARRLDRKGELVLKDRFISLPSQSPRPRRSSADVRRPVDQISFEELAAGIAAVSSTILGASQSELVTETARQFGFERTGSDVQKALERALSSLLEEGLLNEDDEGLVRPESAVARGLNFISEPEVSEDGSSPSSPLQIALDIANERGLEVIDRRNARGALWIVGGPELADSLFPLGFSFSQNGGGASGGRPAWWSR